MSGLIKAPGAGLGGVEGGLWGGNHGLFSGASGLVAGDGGPDVNSGLVLEDGSGFILLEDGFFLLQEA